MQVWYEPESPPKTSDSLPALYGFSAVVPSFREGFRARAQNRPRVRALLDKVADKVIRIVELLLSEISCFARSVFRLVVHILRSILRACGCRAEFAFALAAERICRIGH